MLSTLEEKTEGTTDSSNNECEDEWEGIETREINWAGDNNNPQRPPVDNITDKDLWEYFNSRDMSEYHTYVTFWPEKGHPFSIRSFFCRPSRLSKQLVRDGTLICSIAQCRFVDEDETHVRALKSLYRFVTGTLFDCPRFGPHWEDIGFQGTDPKNDLRGVGFLGLMQALHFASNKACRPLFLQLYSLSRDPVQEFPMMVLSINVTRIAYQALKDGVLNRECNARLDVLGVFNSFYVAIMFYIWKLWKTQKKTIKDAGYVLKDAEGFACKHVYKVLKNAEEYLSQPDQL